MNVIRQTILYITLVLLIGCGANTSISNSWISPDFQSKNLQGTLVIAVTPNHEARVKFENTYTSALKKQGVRAVPSHQLVSGSIDKSKKEQLLQAAKEAKLDTLLVSHYAGTREEPIFHKGKNYYAVVPDYGSYYHNRRFGGYYSRLIEVGSTPDVWTTNKYVFIVSDLYETVTEEHLWQATSETISPDNREDLRNSSIKAFVKQMKSQDLL